MGVHNLNTSKLSEVQLSSFIRADIKLAHTFGKLELVMNSSFISLAQINIIKVFVWILVKFIEYLV